MATDKVRLPLIVYARGYRQYLSQPIKMDLCVFWFMFFLFYTFNTAQLLGNKHTLTEYHFPNKTISMGNSTLALYTKSLVSFM